jgi:hypothetical protein
MLLLKGDTYLDFFELSPRGDSSRSKNTVEDARSRLEQTFAKLGKEKPKNFDSKPETETTEATEADTVSEKPNVEKPPALPPRDPEEIKKMQEDIIQKQKDFLTHRKEVSDPFFPSNRFRN